MNKIVTYETLFKKIIVERSLSYGVVSKITGLPRSTISNYANGNRVPDYRTVIKLIKDLHINPELFDTLFDPVYI